MLVPNINASPMRESSLAHELKCECEIVNVFDTVIHGMMICGMNHHIAAFMV
jgi:hypothetical protein